MNPDILTAPLNQSTVGKRDTNVDEGAVKMSEFFLGDLTKGVFLVR